MIDQILERENYVLAKKLLDVSHARHQALAGNLANAETPGYKRSDIKADFALELQKLASGNDIASISKFEAPVGVDLNSPSVRPDGNNVQLDSELLKMNQNSMQFEFLAQYASNSLNRIKTAITGQV
jgi:flagellar basal-body rod protein FlgB|tara:strand:- start:227 stop:607 length:381 start_codon:yes stop_codon:yes gene_type:complete